MQGYDDDSGVSGIGLTQVDDLDPSYSSPETSSSHSHSSASSYGVHHHHPHHHPMSAAISYGSAGGPGYASSYSSSVSSIAHGYSGGPMHGHHPHHSQDSSPYIGNGQRPSSADMGIESIIHPTGRRS